MKIGVYQFFPEFGAIIQNTDKVVKELENKDFDLVVLPELFSTGYQFLNRNEVIELSEYCDSSYVLEKLMKLAERKNAHIVGGFAEKYKDKVFNSAFLLDGKEILGIYRKVHLFLNEKEIFDPGDIAFPVFDTGTYKIGIMICFDWIFPETARILSLKGADIICHPSNLVLPYCPDAMITRSIENRVFTVTSNRIGFENRNNNKLTFIGKSQVTSPKGKVLFRLDDSERSEFAEIEVNEARKKNITEKNNLFSDRRVEFYSELEN